MSEPCRLPAQEELTAADVKAVRWEEAHFVEDNYTVHYTHFIQHHRLRATLTRILQDRPRAAVVDLGCGEGGNLFALHRSLQRDTIRYIGVDLNRPALRTAVNRAAYRRYANIEFHCGDVRSSGLPAASADVVLCSEVIEHLHDPSQLLAEIRRILAPGGTAVVTTPNLSNYPRRLGDWMDRVLGGRLRQGAYAGMAERKAGTGFSPDEAAGIFGHVSEHGAGVWRNLVGQAGFRATLRRGSTLVYGYPWLARHPAVFACLCLLDSLLDRLPWWVDTSHDLMMLLTRDEPPRPEA
jgi:2-polyprenyl-3-methyl-5-hydroxy-6-metoxy-1,4-benzoquinol methylase